MSSIDPRFEAFLFFQVQNAGLFLGEIPHPTTQKKEVNLKAADSVLDALTLFKDKSTGNLSSEESELLDKALTNIKQLYQTIRTHSN